MNMGAGDAEESGTNSLADGVHQATEDVDPVREISLFEIANVALRHRRLILGVTILLGLVAGIAGILLPDDYVASASFTPQGSEQDAVRSTLVANLGLATSASRQSPTFYAALLETRRLLEQTVQTNYEFTANGQIFAGSLAELYGIEAPTEEQRIQAAAAKLANAITVPDRFTAGVVEITVQARWAPLAEQIAARLLELVNEFNVQTRQSSAKARQEFVEQRLEEARAELRGAEQQLTEFLRNNRRYQNSPELVARYQRLQREVALRQQVVINLVQQYDQARIDAVRNTPVVTVIERPEGSARAAVPFGVGVMALVGGVLGAMIGLTFAFTREFMVRIRRKDREDIQEFVALQDEILAEFRMAGRRVRRALARRSRE